ncbi:MAG: hypothetical protein NTY38_04410, partial [Acidobacteria bacterium]|nr:hypothetical protein [Acidobacteriota bacterium]
PDGKRLAKCDVWVAAYPTGLTSSCGAPITYFRGQVVAGEGETAQGSWGHASDRLGSVRAAPYGYWWYDQGVTASSYFPYGQARTGGSVFGTYLPNSTTGTMYAMHREYSAVYGRFLTPDPYLRSARLRLPQRWNRYSYNYGDPVNRRDPSGLEGDGGDGGDSDEETQYYDQPETDTSVPGGESSQPKSYPPSGGATGRGEGTTSKAKGNARDRLKNNKDCFDLIFGKSKWNTVEKAQQQLDMRDIDFKDSGSPKIVGTRANWAANVEYSGTNGATIFLNSQLFPNDSTQRFDVFGEKKSAIELFNHIYGTDLSAVQVEEALVLHELWHIAGGTDDRAIDSVDQKKALITTCIK